VLLWGSVCHHVKREASRFIPSTLLRSKAGDIITEYDGRKVERVSDLPRAVAGTPVGRDVRFV
jgi:S1-C subfamily serine protease